VQKIRVFLPALVAVTLFAQVKESPIPRLVRRDGRYALFVDGAPFLMLGAQVHNSSAWPAMLPKVWPAMEYLRVNTVEMPVYWEQFEPTEGHYDYSVVDTLLAQAREHRLRLVLLWFGTWKNGSQHYMPEWMDISSRWRPPAKRSTRSPYTPMRRCATPSDRALPAVTKAAAPPITSFPSGKLPLRRSISSHPIFI
jgi:beta-galactosidase GanA